MRLDERFSVRGLAHVPSMEHQETKYFGFSEDIDMNGEPGCRCRWQLFTPALGTVKIGRLRRKSNPGLVEDGLQLATFPTS